MSENLDRRVREYSKYDSMSTEQLQELLRLDAHRTDGAEMDTDELFYIMEVLADRRKNDRNYTGKTVQQAYETFQKHYLPHDDAPQTPEAPRKKVMPAWFRRITAVAAVLAVFFLVTLSANAMGYDIVGRVASWSQEFFHFGDDTPGTETSDPDKQDGYQFASLQEALDYHKITQRLAPTWLPEGYIFSEIEVFSTPRERSFYVKFENGDRNLRISIRQLLDSKPEQVEKSENLIEAYDSNGITYYIFSNNGNLQVSWIIEEFECIIGGEISIAEMKAMIDSI